MRAGMRKYYSFENPLLSFFKRKNNCKQNNRLKYDRFGNEKKRFRDSFYKLKTKRSFENT